MGLLDDAIREHLELRRRTGADPSEVARMEQDALGPVVRGEPLAEPVDGTELDGAAPVPGDPELGEDAVVDAGEPEEMVEPAVGAEPAGVEPAAVDPQPGVGQPTEEYDVDSAQLEESATHLAEPGHAPATNPPQTPPEPVERTAEHPAPAEGTESEELLEKTPEFLQETPEHDRLWFEQGPPQEFDFDK